MEEKRLLVKRKRINSPNEFTRQVRYDILAEETISYSITIKGIFTAEISIGTKKYYVKPINNNGFTIRELHILTSEGVEIGRISSLNTPILSIVNPSLEVWKFKTKKTGGFWNRANFHTTVLTSADKAIMYEMEFEVERFWERFKWKPTLEHAQGIVSVNSKSVDQLIISIGLFLDELVMFNEAN